MYHRSTYIGISLASRHEQQATDTYWAEFSGILLGILVLLSICSTHQVEWFHSSIGFDGDLEVNSDKHHKDIHFVNCPNEEIIRAIARFKQRLHIEFSITLKWIYSDGHREDELNLNSMSGQDYPRKTILNIFPCSKTGIPHPHHPVSMQMYNSEDRYYRKPTPGLTWLYKTLKILKLSPLP